MNGNMELTQLMYGMATSRYVTLEDAVNELKANARLRTLKDTLSRFSGIAAEDKAGLQATLVDGLMQCSPPDTKRPSVERKVRMWLSGDVQTLNKETAIQLCFVLGLSLTDANDFLARACGEGFHWRDPKEIVYIFALANDLDYLKAQALHADYEARGLLSGGEPGRVTVYTQQLRERIGNLATENELEDFLRVQQANLGALHNTAYCLLMDFIELLKDPDLPVETPEEESISIRDVLDLYLHKKFIPRAQRGKAKAEAAQENPLVAALQRDIRQNWPDEATLSRMIHRETDVTRKALILLFLATDGGEGDYADDIIGEQTDDDLFQDMYERMDSMLIDCGFAPLDARMPFDWMVLYSMCADESMFIDGRIQGFLSRMFPEADAEQGLADHDDL